MHAPARLIPALGIRKDFQPDCRSWTVSVRRVKFTRGVKKSYPARRVRIFWNREDLPAGRDLSGRDEIWTGDLRRRASREASVDRSPAPGVFDTDARQHSRPLRKMRAPFAGREWTRSKARPANNLRLRKVRSGHRSGHVLKREATQTAAPSRPGEGEKGEQTPGRDTGLRPETGADALGMGRPRGTGHFFLTRSRWSDAVEMATDRCVGQSVLRLVDGALYAVCLRMSSRNRLNSASVASASTSDMISASTSPLVICASGLQPSVVQMS
jgi:hypothetical protein